MISKIKAYLKEKKIDSYEIFISESSSIESNIKSNNVEFLGGGNVIGLGITIHHNKRTGFASTTDLENYKKCVDQSLEISKSKPLDKNFPGFNHPQKYRRVITHDQKIENISAKETAAYWGKVIELIKKSNPKNRAAGIGIMSSSKVRIINSNGLDVSKKLASFDYDILVDNGKTSTEDSVSRASIPNLKETADLCKFVKSLEKKKKVKTGKFPIIFHPCALTETMSVTFEPAVNLEEINKKTSKLTKEVGKKIFHESITIIDSPLEPMMTGSEPFDDEGTRGQIKKIIDKGVFKTPLSNNCEAGKAGKKSTGNAMRGFSSESEIGFSNIIIPPGKIELAKLIKKIKYGAIIKQVTGIHTMDAKGGNFSQGIGEGHLIENGKVTSAIQDSMVVGNFYEMLNQKIICSKERINNGPFKVPYIFIPELTLVGED
jgi:PmbA protein